MTEKELLEFAAKAAGGKFESGCFFTIDGPDGDHQDGWNPRHDDGDCARMEAAIGIGVMWFAQTVAAYKLIPKVEITEVYQHHGNDRNKARRYASTALAAKIGKAMQ